MFGLPEDDSHIISDLEKRNYLKELEEKTINSVDEALCILKSNLYGDDCEDNKVLEAMEYLCDSFELPLIPYNRRMKQSFVSRNDHELMRHYYEDLLMKKNEEMKKQIKRLTNELYEEWDTLDTGRIDSAIKSLADECGLAIEEKQLKIQRKNI